MKAKAPNFCENLIYLELEGSSQWPQNVDAIRKLRAAYHIRLGDLLTNKFKIKSAVGDDGMSVVSRVGNYIFKLVTVYKREAQIMKEFICPKTGILQIRDNSRSDSAELETVIKPFYYHFEPMFPLYMIYSMMILNLFVDFYQMIRYL